MNDLAKFLRAMVPIFAALLIGLALVAILGGLRQFLLPLFVLSLIAIAWLMFTRR
jgi:hypothetical protein